VAVEETSGPGLCRLSKGHLQHFGGDYGGNLEIMPPIGTNKLGRIVVGTTRSDKMMGFLTNQFVQQPFKVNSEWLDIGHVDEILAFTSTSNQVIVADPTDAYALLDAISPADRSKAVFFSLGAMPFSGSASTNSTATNRLETGIDLRNQTNWNYVRIYSGLAAGQVARIKQPGGHGNGYVEVDWVWDTTSRILDGGSNTNPCIVKYMDSIAPKQSAWFRLPKKDDKYVLVEQSHFWGYMSNCLPISTAPAIITVDELLADSNLRTLNTNLAQVQINLVKSNLNAQAGGSLTFVKVPVIYFGKLSGYRLPGTSFENGRSAGAFTPGLANVQLVGGSLYFAKQFGPRDGSGDIFENVTRARLANALFVNDWWWYHCNFGEVHCGTATKRTLPGIEWWKNQP
jgi:hypothetical protein